ncbi:hypothetical protein SAY87_015281 [Trapa incisa]|uniref:Uncharacterized protein n=1 Tax=Trapa incisa TaxID=236973 RepID=A0AAN7GZ23_9MYRT|nr:hypothetical protein SAY87_015281 [Trapa incisa]
MHRDSSGSWMGSRACDLFIHPRQSPGGSAASSSVRPDVEPPSSLGYGKVAEPSSTAVVVVAGRPSLMWRLITLPISVIPGSLGLVSRAVGLGMWIACGVLSYSLGMIGLGSSSDGSSARSIPVSAAASEAMDFVAAFDRDYVSIPTRPNFVSEGFMEALQRPRNFRENADELLKLIRVKRRAE